MAPNANSHGGSHLARSVSKTRKPNPTLALVFMLFACKQEPQQLRFEPESFKPPVVWGVTRGAGGHR
jgi:hypothetical protein